MKLDRRASARRGHAWVENQAEHKAPERGFLAFEPVYPGNGQVVDPAIGLRPGPKPMTEQESLSVRAPVEGRARPVLGLSQP